MKPRPFAGNGAAEFRRCLQWSSNRRAASFVRPGPKSTDLVLINGYYGLVNQSALAFVGILASFGWWAAAAIGVALNLFILLSPWDAGSGAESKCLTGRAAWVHRLARYVAGTFLVAVIIPVVLTACASRRSPSSGSA